MAASLTVSDATRQAPVKKISFQKMILTRNTRGENAQPPGKGPPPGNGITRIKHFWSKLTTTGPGEK